MTRTLVSLGSNLGDRGGALDSAERLLSDINGLSRLSFSQRHTTRSVGGPSGQGEFLNSAACFECALSPEELLSALQAIESSLGRERDERWAARFLDLDVIFFGENISHKKSLRLPHPRLSFRPFVLSPAVELAGDWVHPELGVSLAYLLETLHAGRDVLAIVEDRQRGPYEALLRAQFARSGPAIEPFDPRAPAPKLLIDARRDPSRFAPPCCPRLALADCPAEHWRSEVLAAVACVWPSLAD